MPQSKERPKPGARAAVVYDLVDRYLNLHAVEGQLGKLPRRERETWFENHCRVHVSQQQSQPEKESVGDE